MTLSEIMTEYDMRRAVRDGRVRDIRRANKTGAAAELIARRDELLLGQIRANISGEPYSLDEKEISELERQIEAAGGVIDPEAAVPYDCDICKDTGKTPDGEMCRCLKSRIYEGVFGAESIDELTGSFDAFDETLFEDSVKAEKLKDFFEKYAREFPLNSRKLVTLIGYSGVGKSFILSALAKAVAKKGGDVMYTSAFSLFSAFHRYRIGELESIDMIMEAGMLIVDDLGMEQMTQNVTREYMFEMINTRARCGLPTLFATNMGDDALRERYTEKVTSRLFDRDEAAVVRMMTGDLRSKAQS